MIEISALEIQRIPKALIWMLDLVRFNGRDL